MRDRGARANIDDADIWWCDRWWCAGDDVLVMIWRCRWWRCLVCHWVGAGCDTDIELRSVYWDYYLWCRVGVVVVVYDNGLGRRGCVLCQRGCLCLCVALSVMYVACVAAASSCSICVLSAAATTEQQQQNNNSNNNTDSLSLLAHLIFLKHLYNVVITKIHF